MDPFTQKILEKAENRSKIHGISKAPKITLSDFEQHETCSSSYSTKDTKSPSKIRRQYSVDKENVDVGIEINIMSKPNIEVQVDFEEQTQSSEDASSEKETSNEKLTKLRDTSRNRLQRLGALYSNADNLSSPIHRTENKFYEENSESNESSNDVNKQRPRRRIGKLAALADSIKNWEDDISHPDYKHQNNKEMDNAEEEEQQHQQQQQQYTSDSDDKQQILESNTPKNIKQLKWDKSVIDSLEAQGFQKRESSTTKYCYDYNKDITEHTVQIHSPQKIPIAATSQTESTNQSNLENTSLLKVKGGLVSSNRALFENKTKQQSPIKQKDPAEMPLRERMMLFEKNKGKAPLPQNNFLLPRTPVPIKTKKDSKKFENQQSIETNSRPEIKDFPVNDVRVKDKVAALLSGPSTISETQIKANRTKQLQEDMNVLANRFHVKKDAGTEQRPQTTTSQKKPSSPPPPPPPMPSYTTTATSSVSIRNEHVDAKCMINNKRRSPGVVSEMVDSASNTHDDAKRIKVNQINSNVKKKSDRLYPVLSEIESITSDNGNCTTATMSTPSIDEKFHDNNVSDEDDSDDADENESYMESDRDDDDNGPYNVNLSREIMHMVRSNDLKGKCNKMNMRNFETNPHYGFEYNGGGDSSINNSSAATSFGSGSGIDNYLDEALDEDCNSDEDDNNDNKQKNNGTTSSNSFCYQKRPKKSVHYKPISEESENELSDNGYYKEQQEQRQHHQQQEQSNQRYHTRTATTPLRSELTVSSDENVVKLVHTVSLYRRQQTCNSNNSTPVKKVYRDQAIHQSSTTTATKSNNRFYNDDDNGDCDDSSDDNSEFSKQQEKYLVEEKIKRLLNEVCKQQQIMAQATQALNLCASTIEFSGSKEAVEAERHLLVGSHRRQAALDEIQRLKIEGTLRPIGAPKDKGRLSVKDITVALKDDYFRKKPSDTICGHHLVCLMKYGEIVLATQVVTTEPNSLAVKFPDVLTFNNVYADFKITLEIYGMTAKRENLPHEIKYHINLNNKKTPKKKDSSMIRPRIESPAGPHVVRTPSLVEYGFAIFSLREIQRDTWTLTLTSGVAPLKGIVQMKINCELSVDIVYKGFLTMYEEISGYGAWHRRWCYLNGNLLNYWKYPDDEKKKTPMGSIDLTTCCSKKISSVSREICTRLNTLLLECQRPSKENDIESLSILPQGNNITIVRYLLSADTKEERDEWCAHFNKALTLLRAWNTTKN